MRKTLLLPAVVSLCTLWAPLLPAQTKAECVDAFEKGQLARKEQRLRNAMSELLKCGDPQCGDVISTECTRMYTETQDTVPSIVLGAREAGGNDLLDVSVSIDDQVVTARLDGSPIELDPGIHKFRFEAAGYHPVERQIPIRPGEKYRLVTVEMKSTKPAPEGAPKPVAQPVLASEPMRRDSSRGIPTFSYVLGGAGLLGLGGFAALRITADQRYSDLEDQCAPNCQTSDLDTLKMRYTLSYVSLGIGVAGLAGAGLAFALQSSEPESPPTTLSVAPLAGGAAVGIRGAF